MAAAAFSTLFYWTVFGAVAVYAMVLAERERQRRARLREMRERRLRRARMDAVEPKPWTYRR